MAIACAAFVALIPQAHAVPMPDTLRLGQVNDGIPSNPADEVDYINNLLTLALGTGPTINRL